VKPEFDGYSGAYEDLLRDPIRDRFGGGHEFFHLRKRDLIREYFRKQRRDSGTLKYQDVGCGKGELATLLKDDFAEVSGCDPSRGMLDAIQDFETRVQTEAEQLPFEDGQFDFVTAVCVYHHVPVEARMNLTREVRRVLKPAGTFCIIEHNPWNPATRLIVSRTPVDKDAVLLNSSETCGLMRQCGFRIEKRQYFLYLPTSLYSSIGGLEKALARVPLGGQYAVFSTSQDELASSTLSEVRPADGKV